jgi:hypothetical protein
MALEDEPGESGDRYPRVLEQAPRVEVGVHCGASGGFGITVN